MSPKLTSKRPQKFLKRKRVISVNHQDEGAELSSLPLPVGLSTLCDLPLDAVLFTQFACEITEGEAKEEIWSSVNYLFFIFTSLI